MGKIICQNCYEILAERKDNCFMVSPEKESILQELNHDQCLLTICCPKCGCMLQVKV